MSKKNKNNNVQIILIVFLLIVLAVGSYILFFGGNKQIKKMYYSRKVMRAFNDEKNKLGPSITGLGLTDTKKLEPECKEIEKTGESNKSINCTVTYNKATTYDSADAVSKALGNAKILSQQLSSQGWVKGNYDIDQWFSEVLNKVDYNPDATFERLNNNTLCVLQFTVAYSNPKPPAVNVNYSCSTPETKTPF